MTCCAFATVYNFSEIFRLHFARNHSLLWCQFLEWGEVFISNDVDFNEFCYFKSNDSLTHNSHIVQFVIWSLMTFGIVHFSIRLNRMNFVFLETYFNQKRERHWNLTKLMMYPIKNVQTGWAYFLSLKCLWLNHTICCSVVTFNLI